MRIALLSLQWPGARMGGIGAYGLQAVAALAKAGHQPHLFTLSLPNDCRDHTPPGVVVHEVEDLAAGQRGGQLHAASVSALAAGGEAMYRLGLAWRLTQQVLKTHRQTPFDIAEAAEVDASGLPLLLENTGIPVVTQMHLCSGLAYQAHGQELIGQRRLIAAMEFAAIHLADGLCAATRSVAQRTAQLLPLPGAVRVLPYSFDCSEYGPWTAPPADGPMLFIGRIEYRKGVDKIALALNEVLPRHPHAVFRFIGPDTPSAPGGGSAVAAIKSMLDRSIAGRVEFAGELPPHAVRQQLAEASFSVMPSVYENFSLAICESFAAGRTAIVSRHSGSEEVAHSAAPAVAIDTHEPLARAMHRLLGDRDELLDLSRQAYKRVRRLCDPLATAQRRVEFYGRVIERFALAGRASLEDRLAKLPRQYLTPLLQAISGMSASLAGAGCALDTPGGRLLQIMQTCAGPEGVAKIWLYGAGKHTARLLSERHVWESHRHRVVGIIDDHPRFAEQPFYLDLPVCSLAAAVARRAAGAWAEPVVLSTDTYTEQFWANTAPLRAAGVAVYRLYPPPQLARAG